MFPRSEQYHCVFVSSVSLSLYVLFKTSQVQDKQSLAHESVQLFHIPAHQEVISIIYTLISIKDIQQALSPWIGLALKDRSKLEKARSRELGQQRVQTSSRLGPPLLRKPERCIRSMRT